MELVLKSQEFESLPEPIGFTEYNTSEGLLNSNYQNVVKSNLNNIEANSVFGVKQRIKSYHYKTTSSIETVLKVSVFMILYFVIFF
jgi:hypothetical protein